MHIVGLLFVSLSLLAFVRISPLSFLEPLTTFLHASCINRLPENSTALPELKALVCAENFSGLYISEIFVSSGLIHLFVVSGAHLLVLQKIYNRLSPGKSQKIFFATLFIYAGACEFNSPVTRSLVAIYFSSLLISKHLFWPKHFCLLLVGLLTLLIEPAWLQSISLQLSWLAAFVVSLNQDFFRDKSFLFKQSLYFFALLPLLIYLQIPSPLVIVLNLFFTPVLEFLLFPLGLLVWFFPRMYPLFDYLIEFCKWLLLKINMQWQFQPDSAPTFLIIFNWALIFLLHLIAHLAWMRKKRSGTWHA
ncbi:MAG: ComEC/Rec2 family competence protein [Bdellovibrio sp.]|nr:ComEC/Rec2 family competence protein [Bdellovibrio sp.]